MKKRSQSERKRKTDARKTVKRNVLATVIQQQNPRPIARAVSRV